MIRIKGAINELLITKNPSSLVQFFRYGMVSGSALAVDIGLLYVLHVFAGVHYALAASLSFLSGMGIAYLGSVRWAFDERKLDDKRKELVIFVGVGIVGLVLNVLLIMLLVEIFGLSVLVAKSSVVIVVFLFNFFARKLLLFSRR